MTSEGGGGRIECPACVSGVWNCVVVDGVRSVSLIFFFHDGESLLLSLLGKEGRRPGWMVQAVVHVPINHEVWLAMSTMSPPGYQWTFFLGGSVDVLSGSASGGELC